MSKKIVAINAGPRMGWNTETLIAEASMGAESAGATVERFDLFRLGISIPLSSSKRPIDVRSHVGCPFSLRYTAVA